MLNDRWITTLICIPLVLLPLFHCCSQTTEEPVADATENVSGTPEQTRATPAFQFNYCTFNDHAKKGNNPSRTVISFDEIDKKKDKYILIGGLQSEDTFGDDVEVWSRHLGDGRGCERQTKYPIKMYGAVGASIEDKIVVCGGLDGNRVYKECYTLDPSNNRWDKFTPMHYARAEAAATMIPSCGWWVTGGMSSISSDMAMDTSEIYVFSEKKWIKGPRLPRKIGGHCLVNFNATHTLLTGGYTIKNTKDESDRSHYALKDTWTFDWSTKKWTIRENLNVGRMKMACAHRTDSVYLIGGNDRDGNDVDIAEVFSIKEAKWSYGPDVDKGVSMGALFSAEGLKTNNTKNTDFQEEDLIINEAELVYIGGKERKGGLTEDIRVFDGQTWTPVTSLNLQNPRANFAAVNAAGKALYSCN